MAIMAPRTPEEAEWQRRNYGGPHTPYQETPEMAEERAAHTREFEARQTTPQRLGGDVSNYTPNWAQATAPRTTGPLNVGSGGGVRGVLGAMGRAITGATRADGSPLVPAARAVMPNGRPFTPPTPPSNVGGWGNIARAFTGAVLPTLPNGGRKPGVTPEMVAADRARTAPPRGPGNNRGVGWGQVRNQVMRPGIDYLDPNYDESGNRIGEAAAGTVPLPSVPGNPWDAAQPQSETYLGQLRERYPYEESGMAYARGPRAAPMPVRASAQPVSWGRYFG